MKMSFASKYKFFRLKLLKSSYSSKTNLKSTLDYFPEYKDSVGLILNGDYHKAVPLLRRVHDVLISTMGPSSPLTSHVACQLSIALDGDGDLNHAEQLLLSKIESNTDNRRSNAIFKQLLSRMKLSQGDVEASMKLAESSLETLQNDSSSDADVDLFHASYGLLGLCALLIEPNAKSSETYLQQCARWSQSNYQEIVALNNLGAYSWLHLSDRQQWRINQFAQEIPILSGNEHSRKDDRMGYDIASKHALEYWDEALVTANKSESNELSPDTNVLSERLKSVQYAIVYATVQVNMAEAYESLGDNDKSMESLAAAFKSLESFTNHQSTQPILGRILGLIAYAQMHKRLAVTSEGYFRSALEKFKTAKSKNDKRYLYDEAIISGGYGQLLKNWDKREEHGKKAIQTALDELKSLQSYGPRRIYLSQAIVYPEIFEIL